MIVTIGIDIGQTSDPTAVAVAQLAWKPLRAREGGRGLPPGTPAYVDAWAIRHLERLPLGIGYEEIKDRLANLVTACNALAYEANENSGRGRPDYPQVTAYMDAVGVGKPVADFLRYSGVHIVPCYLNFGVTRTIHVPAPGALGSQADRSVTLGKSYMVSRLQVLLQGHRLRLPDNEEARAAAREFADYEIRQNARGNEQFGAFVVGAHDDLVTAIGLAVQDSPSLSLLPTAAQAPAWRLGVPTRPFAPIDPALRSLVRPLGVPIVKGLNARLADGSNGRSGISSNNTDDPLRGAFGATPLPLL